MKKRKFKIGRLIILIIIIAVIAILLALFTKKDNKLKNIGYKDKEIKIIEKLSQEELNIIYNNKYNSNLINIINDKNYKKENLELYLKFNKGNNVENIIEGVNAYGDKIDDTILSFMDEKYFISDYLDRYLKYYNDNKDLSYKEIVTRINSNLDYEFYTDSNTSDISKEMYTLVNKYNYLDKNYVPDDLVSVTGIYSSNGTQLVRVAYDNFVKMADDARKENLTIKATTAYRNYNFQATLYNNYVREDGVKNADTYSARPGYSEHQLGYSTDLTNGKNVPFEEFKNTAEYKWLLENAYKYGFILRFPEGKEYITGYQFESWHYRYVGLDIAKYIYENNITYEEYYAYFLR